jgi:RNA polymerase sigma-70 factor, ECF subfamily
MSDAQVSVGDLCDALDTDRLGREHAAEAFGRWWSERDPLAQDLLDELATRAAGDTTSLEVLLVLIDRHGVARPALRRTLIAEHDIADAEQATMAVFAFKVAGFEGRARFTTWLHQIASNEAKMLVRARARRPSTPMAEPETSPFVARLSTLLADRDLIDRSLNELPAQFREVIVLRELDGLEYDEIATALDIPLGTVRSRLNRARALLAELVRDATEL